MEYNRNSSTTSGSNTPTFPAGTEGIFAGMNPQMPQMNPQMAQMNPQMPQMAGMTPQMPQMNPQMNPQMAGMNPQMVHPQLAGMNPQMPQMVGMTPQMIFHMYNWMNQMSGMMPGPAGMGRPPPNMAGVGVTTQQRSPQTPRESVYRSFTELLSDDSPSTVPETQYAAGIDTFSFEELGLSPLRETPEVEEPAARSSGRGRGRGRGKGRGKGKGKAPSSSSHTGAEEAEGAEEHEKRSIWTIWENAALAKAWVGVVEDPYVGANQYIDRLWYRISDAYLTVKPPGAKPRIPEQCRKQWDRLRPKLSRFAALYQNNLRMSTSGMSEEDVRNRALSEYPDNEKFKEFDQWEAFLMVRDSQKFCAGVESGWKRTKINSSGEYSSSAGSHELPMADEVSPLPRSDSRRRRRPMGQKTARGMARGSGSRSGSFEVESEAPEAPDEVDRLARAQIMKTLSQNTRWWCTTNNPAYKRLCKGIIDQCRRDLGMPPIDDDGVEIGGSDVGGRSGTGDGVEDEDEDEEE